MRIKGVGQSHIDDYTRYVREAATQQRWVCVENATTESILDHLDWCQAKGDAVSYVKNKRCALRAWLELARRRGIIERNPTDAIPIPRPRKRRAPRYTPTEAEVVRLIQAVNRPIKRDRWLVYLTAATCGLRAGTMRELRRSHVQLDDGFPRFQIPADLLKSGRPSTVFMSRELAEYMREHLAAIGSRDRVFSGVPKSEKFDLDLKQAGLPKRPSDDFLPMTLHSLRHFCVTRMRYAQTITDQERAFQATHATPTTTNRVYTRHEHETVAKKIFCLQPLMPQGFAPHRRTRDAMRARKSHLTPPGRRTNDCPDHAESKHDAPSPIGDSGAPAGAQAPSVVPVELARAGAPDLPLSSASGSLSSEAPEPFQAPEPKIGVGGFEPPTS
ncbi:MAG: tyrosine-type recombinase/integrase [Planctomycetota bacterium]|nr:tyrosine-type recombinase/integrase [Planctomycetota bacterium]